MEVRFEDWIIPTQETPKEPEKPRQPLLSGLLPETAAASLLPGNWRSGTGAGENELYCRIRPPAPTRRAPRRIAKRRKQGRPVPGRPFHLSRLLDPTCAAKGAIPHPGRIPCGAL